MTTQAKRITLWGLFLAVAFVLGLYLSAATKVADAADKAAQGPAACLACHGGSFETLVSKKPSFKAASGETVNPHRYIPHNEKKVESVPNCFDCHSMHPIPPKEKIDLSKIKVDSCFLACHHAQSFERCDNCHKH
jgi:hypothetical protein